MDKQRRIENILKVIESGGTSKDVKILNEMGSLEEKVNNLQQRFEEAISLIKEQNKSSYEVAETIAKNLLKDIKGEDGHTPTEEELMSLIEPLIPEAIDGHTPTTDELMNIIDPLFANLKKKYERDIIEKVSKNIPSEDDIISKVSKRLPKEDSIIKSVQDSIKLPSTDELINNLEERIPSLSAPIRDSLELLQGDDRLDKSAIKGLDDDFQLITDTFNKRLNIIATNKPLSEMIDVNISGLKTNQALKWNGVEWVPYTPTDDKAIWGEITGDITDQTDLTTYISDYVPYTGATKDVNLGSNSLSLGKRISLENTTSSDTGVIYKGTTPFIHNFSHPTGGTAVPLGCNTFIGINAGNFTMGSTATQIYHGSYNTAVGPDALCSNTTGSNNTAIGRLALQSNTTGSYNTASGYNSGRFIADGTTPNATSNCSLYLGSQTRPLADGDTNEIVIGYNAVGAGSNTATLGNTSIATTILRGNVGIGTTTPAYPLDLSEDGYSMYLDPANGGIGTLNRTNITFRANGENIIRGLDGWSNTWNNGLPTTYFQTGRTNGNMAFSAFNGTLYNRLAFLVNNNTNSGFLITDSPSSNAAPNGYFEIRQSDGTRTDFVVKNDGKVGIGTTTPSQALDIIGNININGTSAYLYDGHNAIKLATKGDSIAYTSTIIGRTAGDSVTNGTTARQTAVGYSAGRGNTGDNQTAVGYLAGCGNTGNAQTAVGYAAGCANTGIYQTALGYAAGCANTGANQTALGMYAGRGNTGDNQTALGYSAGQGNTGIYQTALGYSAGRGNTGDNQTAVGYLAGCGNTGNAQTAVGYAAGCANTGIYQTALGYAAGCANTGANQTALGMYAGRGNTGDNQTALGYSAGQGNTGIYQTALGYSAGLGNTGANVTAIGYEATRGNQANDVVAIGYQAGKDNALANQFIVKQANLNATPLIQGDFVTGNVKLPADNASLVLGAGGDASIYFDGTDLVVNPKVVGSGGVNIAGFQYFTGDGLPYGDMFADDNSTATTISVVDTWYQIESFNTDVAENDADVDNTNDHITIGKTGKYFIAFNGDFHDGTVNNEYEIAVFKNNGATQLTGLKTHMMFDFATSEPQAVVQGIADLTSGDTIEVWVKNNTGGNNVTCVFANLTIFQLGG